MSEPRLPPLSAENQSLILDFVRRLNVEQLERPAAQAALRQLQSTLPQVTLELVSDSENIGGDVCHCLLMTHGAIVYSLSCARRNVLPWQLRGATNAAANDLVTVNGYTLTVENAVHLLDPIWEQAEIAARIIDSALLENALGRVSGDLSEQEKQIALARFYRDRQLDEAATRQQWLDQRGLTETRLLGLLGDVVLRRQVERELVGARFEQERRDRPTDYTAARVMQTVVPEACRGEAERLLGASPAGANIASLVRDLARNTAYRHPLRIDLGELLRHEIAVSAADIYARPVGSLMLLPMVSGETRLVELIEIESAVDAATIERRISRRLMDEWYREQRRTARIEWHWGPAA